MQRNTENNKREKKVVANKKGWSRNGNREEGKDQEEDRKEQCRGCNGATGELFHTSLWSCSANDPVISVCVCVRAPYALLLPTGVRY